MCLVWPLGGSGQVDAEYYVRAADSALADMPIGQTVQWLLDPGTESLRRSRRLASETAQDERAVGASMLGAGFCIAITN